MKYPKISIVTPSYNQGIYIEETILSILNQNYPNLEYIIIDGCSTDHTIDIIKKYEDQLKFWVSEPDKGQWDAILKGLNHCTGDIFNWINSDDLLTHNALEIISKTYVEETALAGQIECFNSGKSYVLPNKKLSHENLLLNTAIYNQQGFWFNLKNLKKLLTDYQYQQFHYSFDRILTIEYLKQFPSIKYLPPCDIARFRLHEESKTVRDWYKFDKELYIYYKTLDLEGDVHIKKAKFKELKRQYLVQYKTDYIISSSRNKLNKILLLLALALNFPFFILNRYYLGALKKLFDFKIYKTKSF